jgi:hypothetical protein
MGLGLDKKDPILRDDSKERAKRTYRRIWAGFGWLQVLGIFDDGFTMWTNLFDTPNFLPEFHFLWIGHVESFRCSRAASSWSRKSKESLIGGTLL